MLCCFQPSWVDPQTAYEQQAASDAVFGYPGQRRTYLKTAGNALAEAPLGVGAGALSPHTNDYPASPHSNNYPASPKQQQQDNSNGKESSSTGELISGTW